MKAKTVLAVILLNVFVTAMTYAFLHQGGLTHVRAKLFPAAAAIDPTVALDAKYRKEKMEYLNGLSSPMPNAIVFLGDSHINGCNWLKLFKNPNIINYGIPGNTTQDVLARLEPIVQKRPQKVFIMVGINDLTNKVTVDALIENYMTILDSIKSGSPMTSIYVTSVIPPNFMLRKDLAFVGTETIINTNERLQKVCAERGIRYIDLYTRVTVGGELDYFNTTDGVHLNMPAYQEWASLLEEYI